MKSIHNDIKPSDVAVLIYYMEDFEGEMRYALRDKDPQTLKATQVTSIKIDKNMQDVRKGLLPNFFMRRRSVLKLRNPPVMALRNSLN